MLEGNQCTLNNWKCKNVSLLPCDALIIQDMNLDEFHDKSAKNASFNLFWKWWYQITLINTNYRNQVSCHS